MARMFGNDEGVMLPTNHPPPLGFGVAGVNRRKKILIKEKSLALIP
jgi:hypothetical protein